MNKRDYYEVLGISKSSDAGEIKKAYRKLAMKFHPDVNKDDPANAEEKFKEINEAYEILSDSQKRQMYDQYGHQGVNNNAGGGQQGGFGGFGGFGGGQGDLNDILSEMFGGGGFGGFGRRDPNAPRKGRNLQQRVSISLSDAYSGVSMNVQTRDGGSKDIDIPKGIKNGMDMRMAGAGELGANGGPSGDMLIKIIVGQHQYFERDGNDLYIEIPIELSDLLSGTEVKLPIFGTITTFDIPALTNVNKLMRIKDKGMPILNSSARGDLYIKLRLDLPKKVNKKTQKLIDELKNELPSESIDKFIKKMK
ncbi:MAG: molecular chaperone DnaJ [Tenericutes bacterium]|nr:MAG: molecular chaperone DnaJ [Mycoplasmatota bacterium]